MSIRPRTLDAKVLLALVGIIAFLLPFILIFFNQMLGAEEYYLTSISAYFYSKSKVAFIGSMWAIATIFFAYKGYEDESKISDNQLANVVAFFALVVSIFPTPPDNATALDETIGSIHFISAAAFLLVLAYMAIYRFTKLGDTSLTPEKKRDHLVYKICGWTMVITIVLLALYFFMSSDEFKVENTHVVLWGEIICLWAFGIAWAVKGKAMDRLQEVVKI